MGVSAWWLIAPGRCDTAICVDQQTYCWMNRRLSQQVVSRYQPVRFCLWLPGMVRRCRLQSQSRTRCLCSSVGMLHWKRPYHQWPLPLTEQHLQAPHVFHHFQQAPSSSQLAHLHLALGMGWALRLRLQWLLVKVCTLAWGHCGSAKSVPHQILFQPYRRRGH